VATLTDSGPDAIRRRVERQLADEDVNLASAEGRERTAALIERVVDDYRAQALSGKVEQLDEQQYDELARELRDDLIGMGALAEQMLSDPDAQEWMVNSPTRVYRDDGQRIARVTGLVFADDAKVRQFLDRLLEKVEGKRLDRLTPRVEARLPDGSRLTAAIPPVSSNGYTICSIRRFRLAAGTLDELVDLEFLSRSAADFLAASVRAGKNIVVCGRVSIGYEARPGSADGLQPITLEDLVADALRMNPDRIIVGECRGPETMAMLWAFATGHAGMTSVHGESAAHALTNLARFALTARVNIDTEQALDWLREIDIVVHCDRPRSFADGERRFLPRRIDQIVEVTGVEGNKLTLNPLFDGAGAGLRWLSTGPSFLDDLSAAGFKGT
jgi:pilus assembly protein CpaF